MMYKNKLSNTICDWPKEKRLGCQPASTTMLPELKCTIT